MRHIHTSIVFTHLATRGNNKILRTPPPHIGSSKEILPRLTRRTRAQLRKNKSPFLKSYLHKVDAKSHSSPLCPLCNTHTYDTHHLFNCTHIRTTLSSLDLGTVPAGLTALLGGEAGWWTTSGNIGLPPIARVMGVGKQHKQPTSCFVKLVGTHGGEIMFFLSVRGELGFRNCDDIYMCVVNKQLYFPCPST